MEDLKAVMGDQSGLRDEQLSKRMEKTDAAVKSLLECGMYKGDTDPVEIAIMRLALDYEGGLSIVKTLLAAFEKRYDYVDPLVRDNLECLQDALEKAEEPEPDPRAGEDEALDDPRLR